jgi:hypothetical protein
MIKWSGDFLRELGTGGTALSLLGDEIAIGEDGGDTGHGSDDTWIQILLPVWVVGMPTDIWAI